MEAEKAAGTWKTKRGTKGKKRTQNDYWLQPSNYKKSKKKQCVDNAAGDFDQQAWDSWTGWPQGPGDSSPSTAPAYVAPAVVPPFGVPPPPAPEPQLHDMSVPNSTVPSTGSAHPADVHREQRMRRRRQHSTASSSVQPPANVVNQPTADIASSSTDAAHASHVPGLLIVNLTSPGTDAGFGIGSSVVPIVLTAAQLRAARLAWLQQAFFVCV